jgi:hypothetical protein
MQTRRAIWAVLVVAMLVGSAPAVWAAATAVPVSDDIPVTTGQTPTVTLATGSGADLDLTSYLAGDELDIDTPEGDIVVSGDSGANVTIALDDITGTETTATNIDAGGNWIELNPADKQRVDVRGDADSLAFKSVTPDDGTTDIQLAGEASGTAELRVHDLTAGTTYAFYDSTDGILGVGTADGSGVLQSEVDLPSGTQAIEIRSEDDFSSPQIDATTPTGQIVDQPDELSADISGVSSETNVTFALNGEHIGSETLSTDGTANVSVGDVPLGGSDYTVEATDELGQVASTTASFETPAALVFREEHRPNQTITSGNATVRFFAANGDIAVSREIKADGTVNMTGLPDSEFVIFADGPNHYTRTVYLESIFEQNTVYLLNETARPRDDSSAVRSRFIFEDLTGKFPTDVTTIQIQRAIDENGDGESEFQTVAGDFWGASSEFEQILERGVRYRIKLVNRETGQTQFPGTHIPTESLSQEIKVSGVIEEAKNGSGVAAVAELSDNPQEIQIGYTDPAERTDSLTVTVESQDGNDILLNETVGGPLGDYQRTISLNESQAETNWIVTFDAGTRYRASRPVGSGSVSLPISVPAWLLTLLSTMAVTFVGALYGPRTALLGSWAMVFVAAGITMFGWAFSPASVLVATLVAVGVTFLERIRPR